MRFAKIALAAVVLAALALRFQGKVSLWGASPDLLFALVAVATFRLPREEAVPVACAAGLLADLLLGGRLGLMALGFGAGSMVADRLRGAFPGTRNDGGPHPAFSRGRTFLTALGAVVSSLGRAFASRVLRGGRLVALPVLGGAAAAHAVAAVLGYLLGAEGALPGRIARAALVALFTAAVSLVACPILAGLLGPLSRAPGPVGPGGPPPAPRPEA